jgi:hypothetical protein
MLHDGNSSTNIFPEGQNNTIKEPLVGLPVSNQGSNPALKNTSLQHYN